MALRVLVFDDPDFERERLCALLRQMDYDPVPVDRGSEALRLVKAASVDLVMLDATNQHVRTLSLIQQMRELVHTPWLPMILFTSPIGDEAQAQLLDGGADDFLSKPINPAQLAATLRLVARALSLQGACSQGLERQRQLLDCVPDPVITLDESGRVLDFNRAAAAIADVHHQPLRAGCTAEALSGFAWKSWRTQSSCSVRRLEGQPLLMEPTWTGWNDGGTQKVTVVLRDVTEHTRMDRMKQEFLATVSHELRTPLTEVAPEIWSP
jgi:CheY-like chemotaxis protein